MFLVEKGLEFENIQIDLRKGEQMHETYRRINPNCTVPALITEGGDVLTENCEIAIFLDNRYPDKPLLGTTPLEKARIAKWNFRVELDGLSAVGDTLRNTSPNMKDRAVAGPRNVRQIPELAERGMQRIGWFFEDLNGWLSERPYVAGNSYSMADITATVAVDFAKWVKVKPLQSHTAILEWHERMRQRPSYSA